MCVKWWAPSHLLPFQWWRKWASLVRAEFGWLFYQVRGCLRAHCLGQHFHLCLPLLHCSFWFPHFSLHLNADLAPAPWVLPERHVSFFRSLKMVPIGNQSIIQGNNIEKVYETSLGITSDSGHSGGIIFSGLPIHRWSQEYVVRVAFLHLIFSDPAVIHLAVSNPL
jgi:hypothetical protein